MGSWNGTCGVTQVSISNGEPVIGFLMLRNYNNKWSQIGHCYSTAYWCPLTLPFEAEYNDYGSLEQVDETDWNLLHAMDHIKNNMVEKELGENRYHDIPVKKDGFDWDKLSDAMHENRIELKVPPVWKGLYPDATGQAVGLMMVHKKVFDAIIDGGVPDYGRVITMKDLMKDGKEIIDVFRENNRKKEEEVANASTEVEKIFASHIPSFDLDMICFDNRENNLKSLIYGSEGADYRTGKEYLKFLDEKVAEGWADEQLTKIVKKLAEFYIFNAAMELMRKTWMPQSGMGGQSFETEFYTTVNRVVDEIIADKNERYAKD